MEKASKKYQALRVISVLYRLSGSIAGISALFFGIYFLVKSEAQNEIMTGIGWGILVLGLILALSLIATSEGIKVFLDIEENTRKKGTASPAPDYKVKDIQQKKEPPNTAEDPIRIAKWSVNSYEEKIDTLEFLICREIKNSKKDPQKVISNIENALTELIQDNLEGFLVLDIYKAKFNRELLEDLCKITTSRSALAKLFHPLVKAKVVTDKYPYSLNIRMDEL